MDVLAIPGHERAHLLELLDGLEKQQGGEPRKVLYRDFTIFPRVRR